MEERIKQELYFDILLLPYEDDRCIQVYQDDVRVLLEKVNIKMSISKLAKFADGDDRDKLCFVLMRTTMVDTDILNSILQDYIIIKRPTDETGK